MKTISNIAVFASGTGTTLQTLIDEQSQHGFRVALVITNRPCPAKARAEQAHIPAIVSKDWEEIDKTLTNNYIQLVVLAGFLAIIPDWICAKWDKRIINIHPSLLPKHGWEFCQEGHRRQQLIRFGQFLTKTWFLHDTPTNDPNRLLFPVPRQEMLANPNLTQNPGYPTLSE